MKLIFLLAAALYTAPGFASPDSAGFVPADWIQLPEEGGQRAQSEILAPDPKVDSALDRIFAAQRDAITAAPMPATALAPPQGMPSDWVPWRFAAFASDLGVSASGLIGLLTFKGTPSVTVIWQKHEGKPNHLVMEESAGLPVFTFTSAPTAEQTEAVYRTVIATGRVKDTTGLRERLNGAVAQFRRLAAAAEASPATAEWYASKLRVDIEVSASGKVSFGTVGGDVKVRLEWFRIQPASHAMAARDSLAAGTEGGLRDLILAMTEDLAASANQEPAGGFRASQFYVGLGLGASGTVGVASGSAQAIGYLYFNRVKKAKAMPAAGFSSAGWYLVDAHPASETVAFARRTGVEMRASPTAGDETLFKIDRNQFRAGLKKAMRIGTYFAQRASASAGSTWSVTDVKPSFSLSVSGALGLAKMTGTASAMIDFQNQN